MRKKHQTNSKKHLRIIIGTDIDQFEERIDKTFSSFDFAVQDLLVISTDEEYKRFNDYCKQSWPNIWKQIKQIKGKVAYIPRTSTWKGLKNSRSYWNQYKSIRLYSEYFHTLRLKNFFSLLGRDKGLTILGTQSFGSLFQILLYWFESKPNKAEMVSNVETFLRKNKLIWQNSLLQKIPREPLWDFSKDLKNMILKQFSHIILIQK